MADRRLPATATSSRGRGCPNIRRSSIDELDDPQRAERGDVGGLDHEGPRRAVDALARRPSAAAAATASVDRPSPANDSMQNGPTSRTERPLAGLLPDPTAVELERGNGADGGGDHVGPTGRHGVRRHQDAEHGQAHRGRDHRHRAVADPLPEPVHDRPSASVAGWNTHRRSNTNRARWPTALAAVRARSTTGSDGDLDVPRARRAR